MIIVFSSYLVEVALEDGDTDILTNERNDSDINYAINGILEAAEGGPAKQITQEASDDHLVRRRRNKRSLIWRHYERLDSLAAARCCICMKKLQCFEGGSTSNLRRHMSKRHPEVFSQLVADGQNPPPSRSSRGSNADGDTSTPPETVVATERRQFSGNVTQLTAVCLCMFKEILLNNRGSQTLKRMSKSNLSVLDSFQYSTL